MATDTGNAKVNAAYMADHSAKLDPLSDSFPTERKDQFLKRINKENKLLAKSNKVLETYFVIRGNKCLKLVKKASGGVYSFYHCNVKKNKDEIAKLRAKGLIKTE